ncbi:hypothetical protein [Mycobacterium sp. IDR2000157661]|uniref:hypothetical protein n=1 Tax=Mycobacterium sp. IDR2000157661 TaxID=2867005 RepID=UPI001EEC0532|nr:hypothetical protein [Mycobacterium sp. IDR2000157661]ULE33959.1 hypothetical protein K3G64_04510 [Mycobacterium sp. IDR2000157661]
MIEGHPRSGNTYAIAWAKLAWPNLVVASHVHHPAHVARANQLGVASLVIARPPAETIRSMLVYSGSNAVIPAIRRWIDYYSSTHLANPLVYVASFEDVRAHMPEVVAALSDATGLALDRPKTLPQEAQLFDAVKALGDRRFGSIPEQKLSIPTAKRSEQSARLAPLFETTEASELLRRADDLYHRILAR